MDDDNGLEPRANLAIDQSTEQRLQRLLWLVNDVDELVEHAMLTRAPLAEVIPAALDRLLKYLPSASLAARLADESGDWHTYSRPLEAIEDITLDQVMSQLEHTGSDRVETDTAVVYGQRLDMSVHFLGGVVAAFDGHHNEAERDYVQKALFHWAEMIDNYVGSVRDAVVKQRALTVISDGLKHPILEEAIENGIAAVTRYVNVDAFAVVCQSDEVMERSSHAYRIRVSKHLTYSSAAELDPRVEELVENAVHRLLREEEVDEVLRELGFRDAFVHDVPIYGLDETRIVGRVAVGSIDRLTPFEHDILDRFADYLRQRVVDFSREWRGLSRTFPINVVERLLREPNYRARFLAPREEEVAVLFTDISGFTRLSEQILKSPKEIGQLIDRWSRHVVDIIWETGGVFDKMVGDCIIGLWGPPFFDATGAERCSAAVDAARRIRDYTAALATDPQFHELRGHDFQMNVATGVNYCPMFVGLFGPDESFTGFSSGMNNAARLQGVAEAGEVLCMDRVVEQLDGEHLFGPKQSASVKNVVEPLHYRALA